MGHDQGALCPSAPGHVSSRIPQPGGPAASSLKPRRRTGSDESPDLESSDPAVARLGPGLQCAVEGSAPSQRRGDRDRHAASRPACPSTATSSTRLPSSIAWRREAWSSRTPGPPPPGRLPPPPRSSLASIPTSTVSGWDYELGKHARQSTKAICSIEFRMSSRRCRS